MSRTAQTTTRVRRRLKVWQRLFIALAFLVLLAMSSTLFLDFDRLRAVSGELEDLEEAATPEERGWGEAIYAYAVAEEGDLTVPFYNEALAEVDRLGRGSYVRLESWEPFVSENGTEYYHVFYSGRFGYLHCDDISDDKSDILQETQVYVRSPVDLFAEPDGLAVGQLAQKGDLLRIVGYDRLLPDGRVNMYEVKLGTEIGWIHSDYVVPTYAEALENWTNEENAYADHVIRGDSYGGGDAAGLDYWPHPKGDFAERGNAMPESVYSLYVSVDTSSPEKVRQYLELAEGSAVNTFVFTIYDDSALAYPSDIAGRYGVLDSYYVENTAEEFAEAVRMVQDAGYYTVARITTFNDPVFSKAYPQWSITDLAGQPMEINYSYWPSAFCREVWQYKVGLAAEAVDAFGFNEVQFDYVRFPDYIINYEKDGTVDLKNTYGESKAQAVQRFLTYASDALHARNVYVSADVFGETSNSYVAPYGQYWPALSNVVDVISGMPYPDHYASYYTSKGLYRYYQHPYDTLYNWAVHVRKRQTECASPAVVRTWLQTWNDADYEYDTLAIQREILGLYDAGITGGYMPWNSYGNLTIAEKLRGVIAHDYYALYREAKAENEDMLLSTKMGIPPNDP